MSRLTLTYADHQVELPQGESFIGRALGCQLRFNDAAISRRHLRVMCTREGAFVENLSMTNGTRINGELLGATHLLRDGDTVEIGHRVLVVLVDDSKPYQDSGPVTIDGPLQVGSGLLVADDLRRNPSRNYADHGFGEDGNTEETRPSGYGPAAMLAGLSDAGARNCPKCRASVRRAEPICPSCGYRWPMGSPGTPTQEITVDGLSQRLAARHIVRVPVIYSSEFLTLDCMARDVSQGGIFISSEILDPVGTLCEITALPDGWPALQFEGDVCHVATEIVNGRSAGFGVAFTSRSAAALEWLESISSPLR